MPEFTGDPHLDAVLETGPRLFTQDTPEHVRKEISKSKSLNWFKLELIKREQQERVKMLAEIRQIGRENRAFERKAVDGLGVPYCRIPLSVIEQGKKLCGDDCWNDDKFMEDFLDQYPECRIIVKHGTKGQSYVNGS
jgi:hypothetical protein